METNYETLREFLILWLQPEPWTLSNIYDGVFQAVNISEKKLHHKGTRSHMRLWSLKYQK